MSPFLAALAGKNEGGAPPIWFMRQAGRYLPEYRALREKHSFLEMCHNPQLAAEVTLQPLRRFNLDAAILFSDILVIPEALGRGLQFIEGKGPVIERPVRSRGEVAQLDAAAVSDRLSYVSQAIRLLKAELTVPLIGFCGGPLTVASYLIAGGTDRDLKQTKQWIYRDPEGFCRLLDLLTEATIVYLNSQVEAGVDVLQIFDSWAGLLSEAHLYKFVLPYLNRLLLGIKGRQVPTILFARGSSFFAKQFASLPLSCLSIDWLGGLPALRKKLSQKLALQGNLDPDLFHAPLPVLIREARLLLEGMRGDPAYIFNLGHGIQPETPVEAVCALVELVKSG